MNFTKFLQATFSVACATAFFACSDKVAGTTEIDNALATEESSSSVEISGGSTEETNLSSSLSSSSGNKDDSSSSDITSPDTSATDTTSPDLPTTTDPIISIPDTVGTDRLVFNPPGYNSMGGGLGGSTDCLDTNTKTAEALQNSILLATFIKGRVENLMATGLTQEQASSTAKQELYKALGLDTFFLEQPDQQKFINNVLNYILGGTVTSDFYKNAEKKFTETGTLSKENFCEFQEYNGTAWMGMYTLTTTGNTRYAFSSHILYDNTMYSFMNCYGTLYIPDKIVEIVDAKCYDMPRCDSSIVGTTVKASYNSSEGLFTCRTVGWQIANMMETTTFGTECDKEGKYIVYSKRPDTSFVCNLKSGWHPAETIDAETYGIECDKNGKLFESPNRQGYTYVCRQEHFCRDYGRYRKEPCFNSGWDFADKTDIETANQECDSEGKTYQSPSDPNLTYVCHDGKWTEFYNMPCDTDNERIKIQDQNITGYVEYICYDKTWRPTYEWHAEYPAEYYFNPEINYGNFTDPRDGYVYHTVDFKGRTWIAENMKYAGFPDSVLADETRCLEDFCENVGRFYNINLADKVCPDGWQLPDSSDILSLGTSQPETEKLISQLGGTGSAYSAPDTYGLSFILSGRVIETSKIYSPWQGYMALFWTNETGADGTRLVAKVGYYKVEFDGWYTKEPTGITDYPDEGPAIPIDKVYLTVRCLKK